MQGTADLGHIVNLIEVFVDDFICCTDNATKEHLEQFSWAMLHDIHEIFPPLSVTGHSGGDPISKMKLDKLEGLWDKLGWVINGAPYH